MPATARSHFALALPDSVASAGTFVPPTVLEVGSLAELKHEVFGPAQVVIPFDDEAEAVAIANGTEYGLVAGVWTNALILQLLARQRIAFLPNAWFRVAGALLAALLMGLAIHALLGWLAPVVAPGRGFALRIVTLAGLCLAGMAIFLALAAVFRVYSPATLRLWRSSR